MRRAASRRTSLSFNVDDDLVFVITGSGFGVRDANWINRHLPKDGSAILRDVTEVWSTINICGPRARDILQSVTDEDISNAAFPFQKIKRFEVGNARVSAARIGYVGELGYELYIRQDYAAHVYEALWQAGQAHGIANAGYRAIDTCRMEKGYLYWSGDIGPDYNPYEAGLGFCGGARQGRVHRPRCASRGSRRRVITRKLVSFTIDGFAPLHGGEAIFRGNDVVGSVTSCQLRPHARQDHRLRLSADRDRRRKRIPDRGLRQAL